MEREQRKFDLIKRILSYFKLYSGEGSPTTQPQYVLIRRLYRFLGLYPNIRAKHLYYERANSFMAPKIFEYLSMLRMTKLKETDTILDLGCGEGTLSLALSKNVKKVVGVDINSELIEDARFKADELKGKISAEFYALPLEEMNFNEGSFDKVFSFSVIEHIPNYMTVFQELYRVLKKGGELIISVDSFSGFSPEFRAHHKKIFLVQHYFDSQELRKLLTNLGFETIEIRPIFISDFSKKWFTRVMDNQNERFDFHKRLYSLFIYYKIVISERRVKQNKEGTFLLARCIK
jgi:ubiquinone/menaquinone biosynthesis C-methylase UbiE